VGNNFSQDLRVIGYFCAFLAVTNFGNGFFAFKNPVTGRTAWQLQTTFKRNEHNKRCQFRPNFEELHMAFWRAERKEAYKLYMANEEKAKCGRPKGGKNVKLSATQKEALVLEYMESGVSCSQFAKSKGVGNTTFAAWIKRYGEGGKEALYNRGKKNLGGTNGIYYLNWRKSACINVMRSSMELQRLQIEYLLNEIEKAEELDALKEGIRSQAEEYRKVELSINESVGAFDDIK